MKKRILAALIALLTVSALGFSNTITFRLNYFVPRAQSGINWPDSLWTIEFDQMTYKKSDFQDTSFGFDFEYFISNEFSLVFSIDTFNKSKAGYYKDFVGFDYEGDVYAVSNAYADVDTFSLTHSLNVSITPLQVSAKITPFGRRSKIIPYFGGGVGLYLWSVRMRGDMIDFSTDYSNDPTIPIYYVSSVDVMEGETFGKISLGYQAFAGIMVPVANRLTIDIAAKFNAAKGKFTKTFQDFDMFDLSGFFISLGVNYWF